MSHDHVLFDVHHGGGWITLNRPQALNALTVDMVRDMRDQLTRWESLPEIKYVVIQGEGRAFCAGGDLRKLHDAAMTQQDHGAVDFFRIEYSLNLLIHNYSKPYIALLHGITMGGGMGISIHGSHRVITENTIMAMPETSIGLFPDVGAAWFLNRCPGKSGLYVALTSARMNYLDAFYMGLATHYVPSENVASLIESIKANEGFVTELRNPEGTSVIQGQQSLIDKYFTQDSLEEIFRALASSDSDFSQQTLKTLKQRSPLSLRTAFEYFKQAENMTIEQIMARDLELATSWIQTADLHEGIRAAVIDKDQKPKWKSAPIAY